MNFPCGLETAFERICVITWFGLRLFFFRNLGEILRNNQLDNVVLETDSPYLAPVPHRGKSNEPGFLKIISEKIALDLEVPVEEIQTKTTENANRLFGLTPINLK